jgi:phospholipid-binding lipoprotein MlaA
VLDGLDQRERNDDELKTLLDDAVDKYATFRSTWMQDRQAEIDELKAPDELPPGPTGRGDPLRGLSSEPLPAPEQTAAP